MIILNDNLELPSVNLRESPNASSVLGIDGGIVGTYTNSQFVPITVGAYCIVGGANIGGTPMPNDDSYGLTYTIEIVLDSSGGDPSGGDPSGGATNAFAMEPWYFHKIQLSRSMFAQNDIFLPPGATVNIYAYSGWSGDTAVDCVYYIYGQTSGVNVSSVGGEPPLSVSNILTDWNNPSSTPSPIHVDSENRVEIEGTNNNILDDFVDKNGRINISKR